MNEKQSLLESLGKALIISKEENKPMIITAFKKYHGIKKKRRKRISRKVREGMQLSAFE